MKIAHSTLLQKPARIAFFADEPLLIWCHNWLAYLRPDGTGHTENPEEAGVYQPKEAWALIRDRPLAHGYSLVTKKSVRMRVRN